MARSTSTPQHRTGYYVHRMIGTDSYYVFKDGANQVGPYDSPGAAEEAMARVIARHEETLPEVAEQRSRQYAEAQARVRVEEETPMATATKDKPKAEKKEKRERKPKEETPGRPTAGNKRGPFVVTKPEGSTGHKVVTGQKDLESVCGTRNVAKAEDPKFYNELPSKYGLCWKCVKESKE